MISKLKEKLRSILSLSKLKRFFLKEDGGKKILNRKKLFIFIGPIFILGTLTIFVFLNKEDSSFLKKTDKKLGQDELPKQAQSLNLKTSTAVKVLGSYNLEGGKQKYEVKNKNAKINFRAQQVISRDNTGDPTQSIPMGTNMIGKTLTAIDTREPNQMVKILLPYGGKSKMGLALEKGTVLFGQVNYSGQGNKVTIAINKGLTPDEREFDIAAQALDPSNYSTGLAGENNSQSDVRVLSALGLSIASGASEIMIERENMNAIGQTVPKVSLGNAALRGLSTSSQQEADQIANRLKNSEDYITLPAGSDVIVSLTKAYVEK